ncbi:DNA internalization-related competence protein ComEC/Rec2 [Solimonas sp. K1W22B-7]|uniref:DNA internalization-related competence protein ComEC/Rec2 n=1 Tax=Solimonas sp. K1W22B-7 TaxID=2303331 RepID=UPI000E336376|nr:DNA internalization-related competence protein ComEC/Rec2 [Solimonas sp. K1W22B-7]AXQ29741.1 DNA internalization-related competence protein ComEC/Rec2 [Solimonas sp. K1W22B-7]
MDPGQRPVAADLRVLILWFTLGVLAMHVLRELPPWYGLLPFFLAALPRWRYRRHALFLALGLGLTLFQAQRELAQRWPAERHGEVLILQGQVSSLPEQGRDPRAPQQRVWRFRFDPETAPGLPRHLRVSWYRTQEVVRAGECWRLELKLRTPHGSLNPGGFDYEGWLLREGVGGTATVRGASRCGEGSGLLALRQNLLDAINAWLPHHPAAPMVAALTLGEQSGLHDADWEVFRQTGTSHLVAISGFNIAIVAALGFFLGRWLWTLWPPLLLRLPAQKAGWIVSGLFALAYSAVAGFEAPVARAALMALFVIVAGFANRLGQPSRVLALAWFLILLLDPLAITSPGLWLSFGAVAAIFYVGGGRLARPHWLRALVMLQLMLTVVLMPLTLYFFHGLSWPAPLVNLLAVPAFALLTPLLLVAMLLAALWPAAGLPLLTWSADALQWLRLGLEAAAQWPQAWIAWSPAWPALLLALLGAVLLFAPRGLPLRPLALLCFLPLAFPPQRAPPSGFELAALDVGQGLAVVVRTAHHSLLYDAGPAFDEGFDAGDSVVVPYLLTQGIGRLDRLLLSHGDNDHAGGIAAVQRRLAIGEQFGTPGHAACVEGLRWSWDGVDFETLYPAPDSPGSDNNRSCVLRIESGGQVALLTGDIERPAEQALLERHGPRLRADLLLSPHHGSHSSSTAPFVDAVQPRLVIHPAAWRSSFGHPRPQVVARYETAGARQLVTGVEGTVRLTLPATALQPELWRRQAGHWWNAPAEP